MKDESWCFALSKIRCFLDLIVDDWPVFSLTDTGRPKTCPPNVSALESSCTRWPPPCATRSTSTASGPSAGTPIQARTCLTTTTTRKGQNSPPSGKRPTSYPVSSSCSTSCTGKAWSNSAWRTALRHSASAGWFKRWLQRPWPRYVRTLSSNFCCDPRCMTSVKAVYGTHILRTHSRHAVISTWRCQVIGDVNHRLITALLVIWYVVVFGTKLRSFMPLSCFHYSPFAWLLAADKWLKLNKQLF